jgi:hypothetical protein
VVHLIAGMALFFCAWFAGAAIYISLVEHPARMSGGTELAFREWGPSYRRAAPMQATLAILASVTGIGTWIHGEGTLWLAGGLLILAVVPVTLVVIRPVNDRLHQEGRDPASAETRALLERWGRLHAIRSVLALAAALVFTYAISYL